MKTMPHIVEGYRLLHAGMLALTEAEAHGMRVDVDYLTEADQKLAQEEKETKEALNESELAKVWRKVNRTTKPNFSSDAQLRKTLFTKSGLGLAPLKQTVSGAPSTDKESLLELGVDGLDLVVRLRTITKVRSTYLKGIIREQVDGYLHPFFHLHNVVTYRSSSSNINFQNIPIRDPEIGSIVRRAFLPRPGRRILEIDYSGVEVRIAACYCKDPQLIKEVVDPKTDMHRDMAMACYAITREQMGEGKTYKAIRYQGKNSFVFPQFYGDYFLNCAKSLWRAAEKIALADGTPMISHLRKKFKNFDRFAKHVEKVERSFWEERFRVYNEWRRNLWESYQKQGYVDLYTGFRCSGVATRNEVLNRPIQGSAFHCLLWSLVELNEALKRKGLKTVIIGQIHDAIVLDTAEDEFDKVLRLATRIMTRKIKRHWDWIIVQLDVEAEAGGVGEPWSEKKPVKLN